MHGQLRELARGLKLGARSLVSGTPRDRTYARRLIEWRIRGLVSREVTFQRNGFTWTGLTSCSITELIFTTDHYQDARLDEVIAWLRGKPDFSRPVIVNVGANLGDIAIPLTRTGKRIIAVEPNPETFSRLVRNVRQNGLEDRITCCDVAISAAAGSARLVSTGDPGNSELEESGSRLGMDGMDQRKAVYDVRTARLEDLLASLKVAPDQVALVVSDTQGFESQVIESGAALWRQNTPLWVEIWPKGLACHGGIDSFLQTCERHFRHFVSDEGLNRPPEPVRALKPVVDRLKNSEFTDVLLLP